MPDQVLPLGVTFASIQALGVPTALEVARRAESLGYRSCWTAEVNGPEAFSVLGVKNQDALTKTFGTLARTRLGATEEKQDKVAGGTLVTYSRPGGAQPAALQLQAMCGRTDLKVSRKSSASACGCSHAAKCVPLSCFT